MPAHRKTDNSPDLPLTLDFEDGELAIVRGVELARMSSHRLIALAKELAKLNVAQELEISRYKAEVEDLEAQADREHSKRMAAEVVERRDLFAMAALMQHASLLTITNNDAMNRASQKVIARLCYSQADAMEASRSEEQPS